MRITVPFPYRLDDSDDGSMGNRVVIDGLDIDVDEVSSGEATKALSYCDLSGNDIQMRGVRFYSERFYALGYATPRRTRHLHRNPSGSLPPTEMLRYLDLNDGYRGQRWVAMSDLGSWYGKPEKASRFCVFTNDADRNASDRQHAEAALKSAAKRFLLVDGRLHYEIREPFIAVSMDGKTSVRNDFVVRHDPFHFRNRNDDLARFGMTEADQAEAFAAMVVPDRGPVAQRYDRLSVFDDGAFRFDASASLATRIAYDLVANASQGVGHMRGDLVDCWLDLRDEMERAIQGAVDAPRILEVATAFLDQVIDRDATGRVRRELGWLSGMIEERANAPSSKASIVRR